ncbi:hypothetical protein [Ktedonobacter sp. SOSP1-52]|uniref:hypothetical protein n=1 Tax=Ktedonobacter sp. SOSP1-52 TaxID=2778366 RepID=UPI001915F15F|nr:hypothetical protein [Ktedonobacter sp. SOSP1-52]
MRARHQVKGGCSIPTPMQVVRQLSWEAAAQQEGPGRLCPCAPEWGGEALPGPFCMGGEPLAPRGQIAPEMERDTWRDATRWEGH